MKYIIIFSLLLIINYNTISQIHTLKTNDGKQVNLYKDGTWKYVEVLETPPNTKEFDCNKYITIKEDKVTGEKYKVIKQKLIIKEVKKDVAFEIDLKLNDKEDKEERSIDMHINIKGGSYCIDNNSKINILFKDGTRIELESDNVYNCKSYIILVFGEYHYLNKFAFSELLNKEIDILRVNTEQGSIEKKFSDNNSQMLKNLLNCLSKDL